VEANTGRQGRWGSWPVQDVSSRVAKERGLGVAKRFRFGRSQGLQTMRSVMAERTAWTAGKPSERSFNGNQVLRSEVVVDRRYDLPCLEVEGEANDATVAE
jgi:hypothetical protein